MKIIYTIAKYMQYIAAVGLLILMVLQVANMIGRWIFHAPIQGTTDLGSYMLLIVVALGFGWAALERRHIKVGLVMDHVPQKMQLVTDTVLLMVCCLIVAWLAYINFEAAATWPERYSSVLKLPYKPFRIIFGIGFAVLAVCTLVTIIENFKNRKKES